MYNTSRHMYNSNLRNPQSVIGSDQNLYATINDKEVHI